MNEFTEAERQYLTVNTLCRLATVSKDGMPQVTPVYYLYDGSHIYVAIDYGEKKLKNLRENNKVALVVDDAMRPSRGIMVQGECEILERGATYRYALNLLFDRFEVYRRNPWGEGESPILKIKPSKWASWRIQ